MIEVPIISPFQCFKLHFLGGFQPLFVAQQRSPRQDLLDLGLPGAIDLPKNGEWTALGLWDF